MVGVASMRLMAGASSAWHAAELRPDRERGGWCVSAADAPSGVQLSPIAQAVLTLEARSGADGVWSLVGGEISISDPPLEHAARLAPPEEAFAAELDRACRRGSRGHGQGGARWEGSGDWLRMRMHQRAVALAAATSEDILAGGEAFSLPPRPPPPSTPPPA